MTGFTLFLGALAVVLWFRTSGRAPMRIGPVEQDTGDFGLMPIGLMGHRAIEFGFTRAARFPVFAGVVVFPSINDPLNRLEGRCAANRDAGFPGAVPRNAYEST